MPLRHRITAVPESVQDLVIASEEKYWEGIELLADGRPGAGIYLLGYTVEMILKCACFLTDGARPGDLVAPRLGPIRYWARQQLPLVPCESYHSLWFWILVLRRKRDLARRPFAEPVARSIMQRVRRVYGIWVVSMRYKPDQALQREAETVYDDVTWIRERRAQLVR